MYEEKRVLRFFNIMIFDFKRDFVHGLRLSWSRGRVSAAFVFTHSTAYLLVNPVSQ